MSQAVSKAPAVLNRDRLPLGRSRLGGVPEGYDSLVLARLARAAESGTVLHIARDDQRLERLTEALGFFSPDIALVSIPAWDCLPYDRVSPRTELVSQRVEALAKLADRQGDAAPALQPTVVLTTVNAVLQRVPPPAYFADASLALKPGMDLSSEKLLGFLERNGYLRTGTVREAGEYALRGGIVDVFPMGLDEPLRLDFFGDELETLRRFDAGTQRTVGEVSSVHLLPAGELLLDEASVYRFRTGYRAAFGADTAQDPLYEAVSAGRRYDGVEHWLPLFHDELATLMDYLPGATVSADHQAEESLGQRRELIAEYHQSRLELAASGRRSPQAYRPLPPDRLYEMAGGWPLHLQDRPVALFTPGAIGSGEAEADIASIDAGGRPGHDFAIERTDPDADLYAAVVERVTRLRDSGNRVLLTAFSQGSRDRLLGLLRERGLAIPPEVESLPAFEALPNAMLATAVMGLERGFVGPGLVVLGEQDILGERMRRSARRRRRADAFISEAESLQPGDLVVHVDHGIGRYEGLETLDVGGAPHDCLRLVYAGEDKLFVPVESIELLSRYGSEDSDANLDRLGGGGWKQRRAKVKKRLRDMAEQLMKVAAAREVNRAEAISPPNTYDAFAARFPYPETEDQLQAINDVMEDLHSGRPMDRLICGDVGFGKTEVALRAAFVAAMNGCQVAVVVPTTLLARQHYETFTERFRGLPLRVEQLSRFVTGARAKAVKEGIAKGDVNIIIGTHALLAKSVSFSHLGLIIVDEEQHFGVAQKERLKQLRSTVHVLTLTATPIPRTLQLALSGVREMSVIATPPVDRLAVRTFVLPFDPMIIRQAIMREQFRGGQVFYVCPRVSDLDEVAETLRELVPEIRFAVAHGQMGATALEEVMTAFCDRQYDMLLSTNIVESGLDIPSANTLIIHRADRFGLAQLYQLRGRVGRSRVRAYAYLTLPPGRVATESATKRLEVMQTLDSLGAGFRLASHDLDIRGAGNLVGGEQSGHVREVGIELYQSMLEEAVAQARRGDTGDAEGAEQWTPTIALGTPVLIPESYVADLSTRLSLYRRLAGLEDEAEIDSFAAELIDRFGPLPQAVENLLEVIAIKRLCRAAGIEKVDAGPKGAVIAFRNESFANPAGLVAMIAGEAGTMKLRPDQKLVVQRNWREEKKRIDGLKRQLRKIASIAEAA